MGCFTIHSTLLRWPIEHIKENNKFQINFIIDAVSTTKLHFALKKAHTYTSFSPKNDSQITSLRVIPR